MEKTGRIAEMSLLANDLVVIIPRVRFYSMSILFMLSSLNLELFAIVMVAEWMLQQQHSATF